MPISCLLPRSPSLVVEPQMENLFHSPFNAALLHAVLLAYPELRISFRALPGHTQAVRSILELNAPQIIPRIEWRTIAAPAGTSTWARWQANARLFRAILVPGERVLFCSISRMQLLQLKRILKPTAEVRAVLHGDLDSIEQPVTQRFPASLFALGRILRKTQPRGLRYLLLGKSILENMPPAFAPAMANAGIIDHPYHFKPVAPAPPGPIVFGIFGNTGEAGELEQVARQVKAAHPEIVFRLIGFLANDHAVARLAPLVEDASTQPITQAEFTRRSAGITYTLWLSSPNSFRLRASGTFFDALAYGKPLVYTANPFVDSYYASAPGIGTRCETLADVPAAITHLAAAHTPESYAAAQAAILDFRTRFTPEALANRLRPTLDWDR